MLHNKATLIAGASLGLSALFTVPAIAYDKAPYKSLYLAPSVGYHFFENTREFEDNGGFSIDDEVNLGLGFGYHFNPNWAVEVNYSETDTEVEDVDNDLRVQQLKLDGFYHFDNFADNMGFYIPFGIGEQKYNPDIGDSQDETSVNVGVGYRYMPFDHVYFRTDFRAVYGDEDNTVDGIANLGIVFLFASSPAEKQYTALVSDDDRDGVENQNDQCPNSAEGVAVDDKGCEILFDSDQDGVIDKEDSCADTPAGAAVDAKGCPVDSDEDGVADYMDKCEKTAKGVTVDEGGCPIKEDRQFNLNVTFENASNQIKAGSYSKIDELGQIMNYHKDLSLTIYGYTDSSGPAAFNQQLSEKRAESVKQAIVSRHNIDPARITAVGKGEADPVADNSTAAGRAQNRRVVADLDY